jgi:hypothetical protein
MLTAEEVEKLAVFARLCELDVAYWDELELLPELN